MMETMKKMASCLTVVSLIVAGCGVCSRPATALTTNVRSSKLQTVTVGKKGIVTAKNEGDVNALNAIIAEQKALGATVSGDLDSDEYLWAEDGRLVVINWTKKNLQGNLSLQELPQLHALYCYGNQLTSLNVSNNTALTELNCSDNQLAGLDVSSNIALTNLYCGLNHLTSLDVNNNTALIELVCSFNRLTNLDVSNNTALVCLDCTTNQLAGLDVSSNTALTSLGCGVNRLTSLDVSNNTTLIKLYCHINRLTSLNISNNTVLESLDCNSNQLKSLDISNCTVLTTLICDEDIVVIGKSGSTVPVSGISPNPTESQAVLQVKKLRVQQTTGLKVKFTWEKVALDNILPDKITVLRAKKKSGPYFIMKQFSIWYTSYTDENVKCGKTYYYKVVAHNGDLQTPLSQKDLTVKKITISYLISPVISISKGTSGGQKYVQVFLQKYEGQYANIYMKSNGRFQKLAMKKRTIQSYRKKYRFRYRNGGITLYFRVRTYQIVKGRKRVSPYSKTVKIKI